MALSVDNDDETSSIDYISGSVDGIKDVNLKAAATRQSLEGHIGVRFHKKEEKRRAKQYRDAVFRQSLENQYNLNGAYLPYRLDQQTLFSPKDYSVKYQDTIGQTLPVGHCMAFLIAVPLMSNLKNSGWFKLIRAMRKDDHGITGDLDENQWLDLADRYGIKLCESDLDFLMSEAGQNPYALERELEAVNE